MPKRTDRETYEQPTVMDRRTAGSQPLNTGGLVRGMEQGGPTLILPLRRAIKSIARVSLPPQLILQINVMSRAGQNGNCRLSLWRRRIILETCRTAGPGNLPLPPTLHGLERLS